MSDSFSFDIDNQDSSPKESKDLVYSVKQGENSSQMSGLPDLVTMNDTEFYEGILDYKNY